MSIAKAVENLKSFALPLGRSAFAFLQIPQHNCYPKKMNRKIDLRAEKMFENEKVAGVNPRGNQARFYWATELESGKFARELSGRIPGKSVLEIGCSSGALAELLAEHSLKYVGVDISDEGIKAATKKSIPRSEFFCTDGHLLPFPRGSFDLVIASGVLHHLDLEIALPEISRVLRKDGLLAFDEPLGINPLFNIYRHLTPRSRTVDEKPFGPNELRKMMLYFTLSDVRFFGFFSVLSGLARYPLLRLILTKMDGIVSASPMKWLMWRFAGFAMVQPR